MSSILNANYYSSPEGKDAFTKVVALNKFAVTVGLAWGTLDVVMLSKPKGYLPVLGRYAYNVGPLMGMATAFSLATYAATNIRGKDDRLNYFIGGLSAGTVYGAFKRSMVAGGVAGIFLGLAAIVKKLSIIEGWEFFPEVKRHGYGSLNGVKHDYTLMAERPRNWSKE